MVKLFDTERLVIRQWQADDAQDLFEYCSDLRVMQFMPFPVYKSINDAHERLEFVIKMYANSLEISADGTAKIDYAVALKDGGKVIGSLGYAKKSEQAGGVVEIGYILNANFQGNGYMTEAVKGLFKFIFDNNIAMRIEAKHNVLNGASGAVMKRAGMTFEGIHRKSCDDGKTKRADMAWYSVLV